MDRDCPYTRVVALAATETMSMEGQSTENVDCPFTDISDLTEMLQGAAQGVQPTLKVVEMQRSPSYSSLSSCDTTGPAAQDSFQLTLPVVVKVSYLEALWNNLNHCEIIRCIVS